MTVGSQRKYQRSPRSEAGKASFLEGKRPSSEQGAKPCQKQLIPGIC